MNYLESKTNLNYQSYDWCSPTLSTICHVDFLGQHCIQLEMHMPLTLHSAECWCWSTNLGFYFLGHIVSSSIHMHNDQISYNNDIKFFIYQTSDHLADLGFDSLHYWRHLQDFYRVFLWKNLFLCLFVCFSPCLYPSLWMTMLWVHLPMIYLFC